MVPCSLLKENKQGIPKEGAEEKHIITALYYSKRRRKMQLKKNKKRILLRLDDHTLTSSIRTLLDLDNRYDVKTAFSSREFQQQAEEKPWLLLFDFHSSLAEVLSLLEKKNSPLEGTMLLFYIDPLSLELNRYRLLPPFHHFLPKPYRSGELLKKIALLEEEAEKEVNTPLPLLRFTSRQEEARKETSFLSPRTTALFEKVQAAAQTDIPLFFTGETGTGKTRLAELIHKKGKRSEKPFVAINCSAIPEQLLESELFGFKRGAFSGATHDHPGRFAEADGGTLFLDEIGDLPLSLQPKLLKVLEERKWVPLGGRFEVSGDFRLICASHQDMQEQVRLGRFREDLYYRINIFPIHLPPLRERQDEIPLLAGILLEEINKIHNRHTRGFSQTALQQLKAHQWKGNLRELRTVLERHLLLHPEEEVIPCFEELEEEATENNKESQNEEEDITSFTLKEYMADETAEAEKRYLKAQLTKHLGRIGRAAEAAGVDRKTFRGKLKEYGINKNLFKPRRHRQYRKKDA